MHRIPAAVVALATVVALAACEPTHPPVAWWEQHSHQISVNGTYVPIVGDFAGSGHDDVLWYAPGAGTDHIWVSSGTGAFDKGPLAAQVSGVYTPVVGDFSGGSGDDILWYAPGPAADTLWTSQGDGTFAATGKTVNGAYAPVVLDDAAGKDDVVWAPAGGGPGAVWSFEGMGAHISTPVTVPAGATGIAGHFGGGVCMDVFWYAPGAAADSVWQMNCAGSAGTVTPQSVSGTYQPVVARFDDDEMHDVLFYAHGNSSIWHADGDGTFTSTGVSTPLSGTPYGVDGSDLGLAHVHSVTGTDSFVRGVDLPRNYELIPLLSTDLGAGYQGLVGTFVGDQPDIFWYAPGAAPEHLFFRAA